MSNEQVNTLDYFDLVTIIVSAVVVASTGVLAVGIPAFIVYLGQHKLRRSQFVYEWATRAATQPIAQKLIAEVVPGPSTGETTQLDLRQTKPLDVRVVNDAYADLPFWKRALMPLDDQIPTVLTGTATPVSNRRGSADNEQSARLARDIKRLPPYFHYTNLPPAPSRLSVPFGVDAATKEVLWGDFGDDTATRILHSLVAGQSGAGKDALLRLWFTYLTTNNTPEQVQFVIIDGKVDWLSPALAESAYMAIPPAGGVDIQKVDGKYVDLAKEDMAGNLEWVFDELKRREDAFKKCGAVDMRSYTQKTGRTLPILFFIASDIGETFDKDLLMLVNLLSMKGRAYGVRMIMSMQNPVGEATKWRSQLGLVLTGHQANADHDRYVLGVNVDKMLYRPSMIPNPDENDISKGLFILRRGSSQHLIRTPHMPENDWFEYTETVLRKKPSEQDMLLESLLGVNTPPVAKPVVQKVAKTMPVKAVLTAKQVKRVAELAANGYTKTDIMAQLGVTNGGRYKEVSPVVDRIIAKVKQKQQER